MNPAEMRLMREKHALRETIPLGFVARPMWVGLDSCDIKKWECCIPGQNGTIWGSGRFRLIMNFDDEYPSAAPKCTFEPAVFHPNVFPSGKVCLPLLEQDWKDATTIKEILVAIQKMLHKPNLRSPACHKAFTMLREQPVAYEAKVRSQVRLSATTQDYECVAFHQVHTVC